MTATVSERFHEWLARIWNGETSLITDDGWLPNPTDQCDQPMGKHEPRIRGWGHLSPNG